MQLSPPSAFQVHKQTANRGLGGGQGVPVMRLRFECAADACGDLSSLSRFAGGAGMACAADIDERRSQLAGRGAVVRTERARVGHAEEYSGEGAAGGV